ncbi:sensory histidine kinase DcuS [compost metagenome]
MIEHAYHRVNTGNLAIDALVTNALNIGQANGIRMDMELRLYDRELHIERYDLCVVLGNMLDNAIEASKKVKIASDRYIHIHIRSSESALFIRIRNDVDREVADLRSRKASPEYHGFGLTNIKRICEKYGGHMTIETESQTFDNMVVLPFGTKDSRA